MSNILIVDDSSFEEMVLNASEPVLAAFTITWLAPCKALTPILESLAEDFVGKIKVVQKELSTEKLVE